MKKAVLLILTLIIVACTGCTPSGPASTAATAGKTTAPTAAAATKAPAETTAAPAATAAPAPTSQSISYPISDGSIKLSMWRPWANATQLQTVINDYNEHPAYIALQEKTGVTIEYITPASGQEKEGFSLMLASGTLPDIIVRFDNNYKGGIPAGYDDGVIIDLTDLIPECAPDYNALITQRPEIFKQFSADDGQLLAVYRYIEEFYSFNMIAVRADWLEELGMKSADLVTYDDAEKYFQGILEKHPDVTPLYMGPAAPPIYYGYNINPSNWMQIDGKVQYVWDQPGYRKLLARLNAWFEKGYLTKDLTSISNAYGLFAAGTVACIDGAAGNIMTLTSQAGVAADKSPFWMETKDTVSGANFDGKNEEFGAWGAVVTSHSKHPEEAVKVLNYFFTEEGIKIGNWGIEGKCFTEEPDGTIKFTPFMLGKEDQGTNVTHQLYRLNSVYCYYELSNAVCNPNLAKDPAVVEMLTKYLDNVGNKHFISAAMTLTLEENSRRASIMSNVNTYASEMRMKFIMGDVDIENDAEWNKYLEQLKSLGFPEAVAITQGAYDRYMSK